MSVWPTSRRWLDRRARARHLQLQPRISRQGFKKRFAAEVGVTLGLAAIVATIAVPSVNGIIASQRARAYALALNGALTKTRSEAESRSEDVTLRRNAAGWASGWQILGSNHKVLDAYRPPFEVTVVGPPLLTYRPFGQLSAGLVAPKFDIASVSGFMVSHQCVGVDFDGSPYARVGTC